MALSTLALIGTGITLYQISQLRNQPETITTAVSQAPVASSGNVPIASPSPVAPPITDPQSTISTLPPATDTAPATAIQSGQFVQPSFENALEVELLKANRISGNPNVVNVQTRIRIKDEAKAQQDTSGASMNFSGTTAQNPQPSETYQSINGKSTNTTVSPFFMALTAVFACISHTPTHPLIDSSTHNCGLPICESL